jgi:hypothetical protein
VCDDEFIAGRINRLRKQHKKITEPAAGRFGDPFRLPNKLCGDSSIVDVQNVRFSARVELRQNESSLTVATERQHETAGLALSRSFPRRTGGSASPESGVDSNAQRRERLRLRRSKSTRHVDRIEWGSQPPFNSSQNPVLSSFAAEVGDVVERLQIVLPNTDKSSRPSLSFLNQRRAGIVIEAERSPADLLALIQLIIQNWTGGHNHDFYKAEAYQV